MVICVYKRVYKPVYKLVNTIGGRVNKNLNINSIFAVNQYFTTMKILLLSLAASFLLSASAPVSNVYICNGPKSTKYHLIKDCKGLNRCSTEIETISLEAAKKKGRTLCGHED